MCGSMADIQSAAAEIRRGKTKKEEEEQTIACMKIYMVSLLHRATINNHPVTREPPFFRKTIDSVHQTGPRNIASCCLLPSR